MPIGTGSVETRENIVALTMQGISELLKEYQTLGRPGIVRVVLASPWYTAKIRSISSKAPKPVKVNRASIGKSIQDLREKNTDAVGPGGRRIESVVTQVYVNGYPTTLERTVMGSTLRIHLYESDADSAFLDGVLTTVTKMYPGVKVSFHSFPLLTYAVLRDIRDEENFTFLDIGGEVTDVAVVHRNSLRYLASFPKGSLFLVRSAGDGKNIADSASRLSLYAKGELSTEESSLFAKKFADALAPWNADYEKTIETAMVETAIPQTTFLATDKDELIWFMKALESVKGIFPIRSVPMTPDFFQGSIQLGESGMYDSFLSIGALYFESASHEFFDVAK